MAMRLVELALRQRLLVMLSALALIVAGAHAWLNLPIDAFPDISPTQVKIILKVPGMTPEEVEQRVATPLEIEMLGIPYKRMVRSVAKYGIVDITIDFEEGVDVYWARQQVSERLAGMMSALPASASGGLAPVTTPLGEMFMFTLEGDGYSLEEKRRVLDWVIRPELRTIPGVADVNALGGKVGSYEVIPDTARMAARGVTLSALRDTLSANNRNDGAGRLQQGEEALVVRVEGAVRNLDDLRQTQVSTADGQWVPLEAVATVRLGSSTRYGVVTRNGQGETVEGLVLGLRGANARAVVEAIRTRLAALAPRLPQGMRTEAFYDRGQLVSRAAGTVTKALLEATVLVCVTLYLFLGGLRAALVVAVTLPLSMLATFLLMRYFGLTANLMSLGGLAVAIGMLVDAAVVVVENIESALGGTGPLTPDARRARIADAVRAVIQPVVAGIVIIAIVFLPLLSLQGLEGKLFSPVALTIVLALGSSLLIALLLVPALALLLLKSHPGAAHEPWLVRRCHALYLRLQNWAFASPRLVYGLALASLLGAAALYTTVGKTFMPTMDEGDLIVQLQKLPSISLDSSAALDTRVQQALLAKVPEIRAIVARAGSDDLGLDPMGLNETDTFLVLKPKSEWRGTKDTIAESIRQVMETFPGVVYGFTQPIEMRVSEMLTGTRGDVAIKVFGSDLAELNHAAQAIAAAVRPIAGAEEVIAPRNEGVQYLSLAVRRQAVSQAGLSVDALQDRLRAQLEGETLGVIADGRIRTPLILRGGDAIRNHPQAFSALQISAPDGRAWPLSALADIRMTEGPIRIDHENGSRFAVVQVSVAGRDLGGFVADAQRAVASLQNLPPGLRLEWGGQFENQQRAAARLALVVPVALAAIFLLLLFTFGSLRQAVLVFVNIPFALTGGIAALALSGEYLSVPASVGFIALLGIAVLNGVVMVTHFNELHGKGMPLAQVVREGAQRRLRPVLMTAAITALGMIPLLFANGPGSEIQRPLAIVVSGGLLTSTALTLLLLPLLFARFGIAGEIADTREAGNAGDPLTSSTHAERKDV